MFIITSSSSEIINIINNNGKTALSKTSPGESHWEEKKIGISCMNIHELE